MCEKVHPGLVTPKRCLIVGIWTFVLICIIMQGVTIDSRTSVLLFPLLGLPWLLLRMHDNHKVGKAMDAGDGVLTILCGALLSLVCALPVVIVAVMLRKLFGGYE